MDDSKLSKLIQQCKANDVDAKIDAVTKLQAEFEAGVEVPDPDAVIQVFKACLRVSHQHLLAATLSALPSLFPLILSHTTNRLQTSATANASTSSAGSSSIDLYVLRQVITAFLPQGGVIDRLGDSRERVREKARESLVLIGGYAFRSGGGSVLGRSRDGKAQETPLQMFERFLKDGGLTSKVWRVREQSVLTLVDIRRAHHLFPIRPYLTSLVAALEDSDSTVRETTRTAVVELFTGPGVTDAARADLKREMTKKGVRKGIVDGVLAKVLAGDSGAGVPETTANGDGAAAPMKKEYIPPSLALQGRKPSGPAESSSGPSSMSRSVSSANVKDQSRPASRAAVVSSPSSVDSADVQAVYIASSRDLENEFSEMFKAFEGKETEHNWAARERAITRMRGMIKGDVHVRFAETFLSHLKQMMDASLKTLASLRTTVATNTCSLYSEFAVALGPIMDPVCETVLLHLVRMAGFTKKITAQASQASVVIVIKNTSPQPRVVLPLLANALQDKTFQARAFVVDHLRTYISLHAARAKGAIESTGMLDTLEKAVRKALADANAGVRQSARMLFWDFERIWPERGRGILEAQDSMSRKQLEKACPNPETLASVPATPPATKKSSVAAAIAASRAKAKAIATAPPSLRHQATSTARVTSPPKRSMSPSLSTGSLSGRAGSPLSRSELSPSSPGRSRILSGYTTARSVSGQAPIPSHSRNSSGDSTLSQTDRRPTSPVVSATSSPPRGTLRRAAQTPLPSSPPATTVTSSSSAVRRGDMTGRNPAANRNSIIMAAPNDSHENTLLTAVAIPLPEEEDSDMDMDESANPVAFASPQHRFPPPRAPQSHSGSLSPRSNGVRPELSTSLSTGSVGSPPAGISKPIVEDVLRARAEQAQSAAERLLELVEPETEAVQLPSPPASLLLTNEHETGSARISKAESASAGFTTPKPPVTPNNKSAAIWRQAAAFQDSPAYSGMPSLMTDVLPSRPANIDGSWWRKRMTLVNHRNRLPDAASAKVELQEYVTALDQGVADVATLKKLALFCINFPSVDPISPLSSSLSMPASPSPFISNSTSFPTLRSDIWGDSKAFGRLFNALKKYLGPERDEDVLEYGLIVLWEMLENQTVQMESREADVFSILLRIRYSNKQSILQATNAIRDTLTERVEGVYGLTTMHASLIAFQADPMPAFSNAEVKASTSAFALIALGKFILHLPSEILEDELPRLKSTLISALNDTSSLVVRESAAAVIIAAQLILRDETHLFTLLDGLADEKKNLLTYLFDKHGARSVVDGHSAGLSMDRLEREMRRLDGRTGTPPRPVPA